MKRNAIVIGIFVLVMTVSAGIVSAQGNDRGNPPGQGNGRGPGMLDNIITLITEETGLTHQEIAEQLRGGATLSGVIENADGDVDAIIATVQAEVNARIEEMFTTNLDLAGRPGARMHDGVAGQLMTAITDATGLQMIDVMQQIGDGATLATIITDNGGDVDALIATVVDAITTAVNDRVTNGDLTQENAGTILANLEQTVTDMVNGDIDFPVRQMNGVDRIRDGVSRALMTALTDATGLQMADIAQQLRDGETLSNIITSNGGDVDTITANVVDTVTTAINERVANGDLTQENADTILANLEQTTTDFINGDTPFPGRQGHGRGDNN